MRLRWAAAISAMIAPYAHYILGIRILEGSCAQRHKSCPVPGAVQEHTPADGPKIKVVNLCVLLIGTGKGIRHANKICKVLKRAKGDSETFTAASIRWGSLDASNGARPPSNEAIVSRFPVQLPYFTPPTTGSTERWPKANSPPRLAVSNQTSVLVLHTYLRMM
ncbi:uncharacterized protein BDW70DRAFT_107920 [Aspergillus foveolatus]|uniref:uncharacterized protein n=1 Tax=Aspergillus foveolatus TaxID=210207 RepID=UPI003CCD7D65